VVVIYRGMRVLWEKSHILRWAFCATQGQLMHWFLIIRIWRIWSKFVCEHRDVDETETVLGGTAVSLVHRSVARHFFVDASRDHHARVSSGENTSRGGK